MISHLQTTAFSLRNKNKKRNGVLFIRNSVSQKGVSMKKRFIAIGAVILIAAVILAVAVIKHNSDKNEVQPDTTVGNFEMAQLGVTVDSWLKIIRIDEYNGRLAVIAENVSDTDVEYAVLSVETKSGTLTFNISALLSGTKAALLCNEEVACDPSEVYTAWQTKDMIIFEKPPVMNDDIFELQILDGSVSVKNISGKDINSDIFIYYKDKDNDLVNGSITYKFSIKGLKADSLTYVKAPELNEDNCRIIFTDYDNN